MGKLFKLMPLHREFFHRSKDGLPKRDINVTPKGSLSILIYRGGGWYGTPLPDASNYTVNFHYVTVLFGGERKCRHIGPLLRHCLCRA